jgi:hypothetical protein
MASIDYMQGRKKYSRPQAMMLSDNPGRLLQDDNDESFYVPEGFEVGAEVPEGTSDSLIDQFIILSDDNRGPISFATERIEKRERMINGRMRSYHIADKLSVSASWTLLPSRGFSTVANFNSEGVPSSTVPGDSNGIDGIEDGETVPVTTAGNRYNKDHQYTTDGGAGGMELLDWYETHQGPFWLFLSYDKYKNLGVGQSAFDKLNRYSQVVEVFFSDFSYSIEKRGGSNHDFWNISFSLEEV